MNGQIEIDKVIEYSKSFSEDDVIAFSEISEDNNPIHIDEKYASRSIFRKRVVHGMLVSSMFSKIFGTIYPGNSSIYLSQTVKFLKPVYINEKVKAKITLKEFDNISKRGMFTTECFNEDGNLVITGKAIILFPKSSE